MPNPKPPIPSKIEDEGLRSRLDRTRERHNGYGYDEFVKRYELHEPKTVMARAFNVSTNTIRYWIELYEKEFTKQDE